MTVAGTGILASQASGGSISIGGTLNLLNGSTLDLTDGNIDTLNVTGSRPVLKIGSATGSGATLKFDLGNGSADELVASGSAAVLGNNTVVVNPIASSLSVGSNPLISASSGLAGTFTFAFGATTQSMNLSGTVYSLSLTNSGTLEQLDVQMAGNTVVWGGGVSTVWANGSNWIPTGVPGAIGSTNNLDTIVFNSSPTALSPVVDAGRNVQNITFDSANVGAINLTGSALTLSALGITQTTSTVTNKQTVSVPLLLEGNYTFLSNSATNASLTLTGNITWGAGGSAVINLTGNSTGANKITGVISDGSATPMGVTKSGSGTWALLNSNSYSGDTNINFGVLQIANGGVGSSGNVIFNGGTLQYATGTNQDLANRINNSTAPIVIDTNGNTVVYYGSLSSSNTAGLTNAGITQINTANSLGGVLAPVTINAGTLEATNSITSVRNFSIGSASSTIMVDTGQTYTLTGSIGNGASAGVLNKTGSGTLVLAGSSTFSGGTFINSSTLVAAAPKALGTGPVTLAGSSPVLQILPSPVGPTGFGFSGHNGWTLNTGDTNPAPSVSGNNVLTLTTTNGGERRSAWYNTPVPVTNFTASFLYQASPGGGNIGDGIAFVLQNSPAGAAAPGSGGNAEGYGGLTKSAALAWELYSGIPYGIAQGSNGVLGAYQQTTPALLLQSADPILVTITGAANSNNLSLPLADQAQFTANAGLTYSNTYMLADTLGRLLGGTTAHVGFTGSTGGASTTQTISNFTYANPFTGTFSAGNNVVVQTDSTI